MDIYFVYSHWKNATISANQHPCDSAAGSLNIYERNLCIFCIFITFGVVLFDAQSMKVHICNSNVRFVKYHQSLPSSRGYFYNCGIPTYIICTYCSKFLCMSPHVTWVWLYTIIYIVLLYKGNKFQKHSYDKQARKLLSTEDSNKLLIGKKLFASTY